MTKLAAKCSKVVYEASRWSEQKSFCAHIWWEVDIVMSVATIVAMGCLDFVAYVKFLAHRKVSEQNMNSSYKTKTMPAKFWSSHMRKII